MSINLNPLAIVDLVSGANLADLVIGVAKTGFGLATRNVILIFDGVSDVADAFSSSPKPEYVPSPGGAHGYAAQGPANHVDPEAAQYLSALETLEANFETLDAYCGGKDGKLSKDDLDRIRQDKHLSPELRRAAQFFFDNPQYFARLNDAKQNLTQFGPFTLDWEHIQGAIPREDIRSEIESLRKQMGKGPAAPPSGVAGGGGSGATVVHVGGGGSGAHEPGSIRGILANPSLGLEEKIQLILAAMLESTDQEIEATMEEMGRLQEKKADLGTDKGAQKKAAEAQQSWEKLQVRLQRLIEKRKQMFELMSNISQKFSEMARTAISNLGRA